MYVCRLFNNIEFKANPLLYTIAQCNKTSVDFTMFKIRNEKNIYIYKIYDSGSCRPTTLRSDHANSTDLLTQWRRASTPWTILLTAETNETRVGKIFIPRPAAKYNKGLNHCRRAMSRNCLIPRTSGRSKTK
jgi:hypothetical protein